MNVTLVLPWLSAPLRDRTLSSMRPMLRDATVTVDNSSSNRGVAWSWNRGIDAMYERGDDWLVLVSTTTMFGKKGGLDLLDHIMRAPPHSMVSAINGGWHLHAIPREFFDLVGPFDEWFISYYEDSDWQHRLALAGCDVWQGEGNWHVEVNAQYEGNAQSVVRGLVPAWLFQDGMRKYALKWGVHPRWGGEYWPTPFNDPALDWTWTWQHSG